MAYEYRRITLDFYSSWLNETQQIKQDNVIHECVHFNVNILYNEALDITDTIADGDDKFKQFANERLRIACESVTQDLTFAILNKFNDVQ